jgi:hypothetical protein
MKERLFPEPSALTGPGADGLTTEQRDSIRTIAARALKVTTDEATDPSVKAGVKVTYHNGLSGAEDLRKRGDMLVYIVSGVGAPAKRSEVVRSILTSRGWDKDARNRTKETDKLREDANRLAGFLTDAHFHDPRTGVVIVDLSSFPARKTKGNLTAIAGHAIHEGIGHPAGLQDIYKRDYKGLMGWKAPMDVKESEIQFDKGERARVNEYLLNRVKDPRWEYR